MESGAIAAQERKANHDFAEAEKKAAKRSWFGGTSNKEDAAELFKSAGVAFKVAKLFDRGGIAFVKAAELHQVLGNRLDELNMYNEAAGCYKQYKDGADDAIRAYSRAAEMCMDANRMGAAAKNYREIGEIYDGQFAFDKSITAFKQAADFFKMDNQSSNANTCNLKVAAHSAQHLNDFDTAVKIFETVGKEACANNLLKYSAKKYFFHAGLCRLASGKNPVEDSRLNITAYADFDVTFSKQREGIFLLDACDALEAADAPLFTQKITAFDQIITLDTWTTNICLRIKNSIATTEAASLDLCGDGPSTTAASAAADDDDLC